MPGPAAQAAGVNLTFSRHGGVAPDPFQDLATLAMPRSLAEAYRRAEQVYVVDPSFKAAIQLVASYFITDVEIVAPADGRQEVSAEERTKYCEFLIRKLGIKSILQQIAVEYLVYGLVGLSVIVPNRQRLRCPKCNSEYPYMRIAESKACNYRWSDFQPHARCPNPECRHDGAMEHITQRGFDDGEITHKIWPPHELEVREHPISRRRDVIWAIPDQYRRDIQQGVPFFIQDTPKEVLEAVRKGDKVRFQKDFVFLAADPVLSGLNTRGYGYGQAVMNFRQAWHCQLLRRFNEAIAIDFLVPTRVLTPGSRGGSDAASADGALGINLGQFTAKARQMLMLSRKNPGGWNVFPFPIESQLLGGEGNQLIPAEQIERARDDFLNASGVPVELYRGSLTAQAAPAALRLFESRWARLVEVLNAALNFVVDRVSRLLGWSPVDARLKRVTIADDINKAMAELQMFMGRQLSGTTALASLGRDWKQEQIQMMDEAAFVAEQQRKLQEEMQGADYQRQLAATYAQQQQQAQGAAGGSGDPTGGQPSQAPNPEDVMAQAEQIAQEYAALPDPSERRSKLIQLRRDNRTLHHLVTGILDEQRRQENSSAGREQRQMQQQSQDGQPMKAASWKTQPGIVSLLGTQGPGSPFWAGRRRTPAA